MENGVPPEQNFDNFLNSFSLVFITLTNDGALVTYEKYTLAAGQAIATVFFVVLAIVGQKILLNLFIAILLENFDESALKQKMFEYEEEQRDFGKEENFFKRQYKKFVNKLKEFFEFCRKCAPANLRGSIREEEEVSPEKNPDVALRLGLHVKEKT